MIRKILAASALVLAIGAATTLSSAPPAEAKCKFNCGLAIGLGAGILGSAIVDANRRDYYNEGYNRPSRYNRYSCRQVRQDCRYEWGHGTRRYYRCLANYGC